MVFVHEHPKTLLNKYTDPYSSLEYTANATTTPARWLVARRVQVMDSVPVGSASVRLASRAMTAAAMMTPARMRGALVTASLLELFVLFFLIVFQQISV